MCDVLCDQQMGCRYPKCGTVSNCLHPNLNWHKRKIGLNANITYHLHSSTNPIFIQQIKDVQFDFIYLDGAHDHANNVLLELKLLYPYLKKGGVMAGSIYHLVFKENIFIKLIRNRFILDS